MPKKKVIKKKSVIIHKPVKQPVNKINKTNLLINFIVLVAAVGLLSTVFPIIKSEILFRLKDKKEIVYIPEAVKVSNGKITPDQKIEDQLKRSEPKTRIIYPVSSDFGIIIPKIDVNYKIIPNVSPDNEKEFTAKLKEGIAHAKGTDLPGSGRKIYLFSHSSSSLWEGRANVAFYLLKDLQKGDKVYLFFRQRRYDYEVTDKIITNKDDTKYLSGDLNKDILVLQTCYPPGTDWKRLLVLAKPI